MVRLGGFEPPTLWFVARYSIQLSYKRIVWLAHYRETSKVVNLRHAFYLTLCLSSY